jgi:hypothetical protein
MSSLQGRSMRAKLTQAGAAPTVCLPACLTLVTLACLPRTGLLVPDIPLEETPAVRAACNAAGLELVLLATPTTPKVWCRVRPCSFAILRFCVPAVPIQSRFHCLACHSQPLAWLAHDAASLCLTCEAAPSSATRLPNPRDSGVPAP